MRVLTVMALLFVALISAPIGSADAFTLDQTATTAPGNTLQDVKDDIQEARRCMALSFITGAVHVGMADAHGDWAYADAPYVVGEWNDALLDEYLDQSDTGIQDPHVWLVTSTNDCMVAAYGNPEGA